MRLAVDGIRSPHPIISLLPAIFQEDAFATRFTASFDDVLAPVINTLDCLEAYFDPSIAPHDFLEWLATWVGLVMNENSPIDRQRAVVAQTVGLYRTRGTVSGLRAQLELVTGGRVVVADSGGVGYSVTPGGELPGEDTPRLAVRVFPRAGDEGAVDGLEELVAASKPAHVIHQVEVGPS